MPIEIGPSDGLRRLGYLVVIACVLLPLAAPLAWPWRFALAALTLLVGVASWRLFLQRCPDALIEDPDGRLALLTRDGRRLRVNDVERGIVRPWLVSAVLRTPGGRVNLWVPGWALPEQTHWRLRRALIGFRRSAPAV